VIAMVKTYGIVPAESYTGLVDGEVVHNHGEVFKVVEDLVKRYAQDVSDPRWLRGIAGLVDGFLGTAPTTVKVNGVDVTPLEYARDHLKIPVNDYVEVMSFNYAPFYEKAQLLVPDNWMMYGDYLNLPIDDFMSNFEAAVRNGYSVAIDLDVSEDTYRPGEGLAQLTAEATDARLVDGDVRSTVAHERGALVLRNGLAEERLELGQLERRIAEEADLTGHAHGRTAAGLQDQVGCPLLDHDAKKIVEVRPRHRVLAPIDYRRERGRE
jgi:hypothetical protein